MESTDGGFSLTEGESVSFDSFTFRPSVTVEWDAGYDIAPGGVFVFGTDTVWQSSMPDCDPGGHLEYSQSSNTFSCAIAAPPFRCPSCPWTAVDLGIAFSIGAAVSLAITLFLVWLLGFVERDR